MGEKWYSSREIRSILKISSQCLYAYRQSGQIKCKQISDKKYLYQLSETFRGDRSSAIYGRVSTTKQKRDLENQINVIKQFTLARGVLVPADNIFSDIGSGMNENRKDLQSLLQKVNNDEIDVIYITHKDRLTRFGFQYLEMICSMHDTKIVCLDAEQDKTFEQELSDDLIAIIHYFSMRFYGKRKNVIENLAKRYVEETSNT